MVREPLCVLHKHGAPGAHLERHARLRVDVEALGGADVRREGRRRVVLDAHAGLAARVHGGAVVKVRAPGEALSGEGKGGGCQGV